MTGAGAQQEFGDVVGSLEKCLERIGPWNLSDLSLGLLRVAQRHAAENIQDNLPGSPRGDRGLIEWLRAETQIAAAAYCIPDAALIAADSGGAINVDAIVHVHQCTDFRRFRPAYFVAVGAKQRAVRVVVRGTLEFTDVLTDLTCNWVPYSSGGHVHEGFLHAAEWLLGDVSDILAAALKEHSGYELVFSGHSLGAGTAAVATDLLHRQPYRWPAITSLTPAARTHCFCAAPPPVFSLNTARAARRHTTSLALGHDLFCRLSLANFEQLRLEVLASGYLDALLEPSLRSSVNKYGSVLSALEAGALALLAAAANQEGLNLLHHLYVRPTAHSEQKNAARQRVMDILKDACIVKEAVSSAVSSGLEWWAAATPEQRTCLTIAGGAAAAAVVAGGIWCLSGSRTAVGSSAEAHGQSESSRRPLDYSGRDAEMSGGARGGSGARGGARGATPQEGGYGSVWKGLAAAGMILAPVVVSLLAQGQNRAGSDGGRDEGGISSHHNETTGSPARATGGSAVPTSTELQNAVAHLDHAVHSVHLYCPGRLLHLQRRGVAGPGVGVGARSLNSPRGASGRRRKGCRLGKLLDGALRFVLVDGEPEARFEFIAVRKTWRLDHLPANILVALESLR